VTWVLFSPLWGCLGEEVIKDAEGIGGPAELASRVTDGYYRGVNLFEVTIYKSRSYDELYGRAVFHNSNGHFFFRNLPADTVDLIIRTPQFFTFKLGEIPLRRGWNTLREHGAHIPANWPEQEMLVLTSISCSVYRPDELYLRRKSYLSWNDFLAMIFAADCDTVHIEEREEEDEREWELVQKPPVRSLKDMIDCFAFKVEVREVSAVVEQY